MSFDRHDRRAARAIRDAFGTEMTPEEVATSRQEIIDMFRCRLAEAGNRMARASDADLWMYIMTAARSAKDELKARVEAAEPDNSPQD